MTNSCPRTLSPLRCGENDSNDVRRCGRHDGPLSPDVVGTSTNKDEVPRGGDSDERALDSDVRRMLYSFGIIGWQGPQHRALYVPVERAKVSREEPQ